MKKHRFLFCLLAFLSVATVQSVRSQTTLELTDICIRDPYILPDAKSKTYYMYRSAPTTDAAGKVTGGVEVWKSRDLNSWEGPIRVFTVPENNWITGQVWAPEVHRYRNKYYLFATLNSDIEWKKRKANWPPYLFRGTQIFYSDSPEGPFEPFDRLPHTPMDEMALDGTLWVEEGVPYMVYCHEWVQITDGSMKLVRLSKDLSKTEGRPMTLFHASSAAWSTGPDHFVTDGCFLYRTHTGKLLMIWSSFMNDEYAIGVAESTTGRIAGPWRQQPEPLFTKHGGHGMIFRTFDGRLCLVLHQPNSPGGMERARIFTLEDLGDTIRLKAQAERQ